MAYVRLHDLDTVKKRLGIDVNGRVQRYFQNECYKYMDKYVPYKKGGLRRDVDLSDNTKIVYNSKYAEYQYYGQREDGTHVVTKYTTAGTGKYWDRRMMSAEGEDLVNKVQKFINRGGK